MNLKIVIVICIVVIVVNVKINNKRDKVSNFIFEIFDVNFYLKVVLLYF